MNKDMIMEAMECIEPELIAAADCVPERKRRNGWVRAGIIAACLCLVLTGTAVAWNSSQVRLSWVDETSEDWLKENDVAYTIDHDYAYFPLDCFSDDIVGPADEFAHQLTSWSFRSLAEMEDFLGLEVWDNPVLDAAAPGHKISSRGMKGDPTHILLTANYNGKGPTSIFADTNYIIDGVWVRPNAQLYTDLFREEVETIAEYNGEPGPGIVTSGDFRTETDMEEVYTAPNGLEAVITRSVSVVYGPEMVTYLAHFDANGIRFNIEVQPNPVGVKWAEYEDDPEHTLEVLKEVLDEFTFDVRG